MSTRYTLTVEQVSRAIAGHDLGTFNGWTAAAKALLEDAPLMTGIKIRNSADMILKTEFDGRPEVVLALDVVNGIYCQDLLHSLDHNDWLHDIWDFRDVEHCIATLSDPAFATLRQQYRTQNSESKFFEPTDKITGPG